MRAERRSGRDDERVGAVTADETDGMTDDGITRAGVLLERRNEEQVSRGTERRKDEGAPGDNREER